MTDIKSNSDKKLLKFKTIIGGFKCEIECDKNLYLSDYIPQIKKSLGFDNDDELKFNHGTTIITHDTKITSVTKTVPIGVLKVNTVKTNASEKINSYEEKYTLNEIHTMLPFFMLYFKIKDPEMFKLFAFSNNENTFASMILHKKYFELTKILMKQSTDILNARHRQLEDGKVIDIKITIPDSQSLEILASQSEEFNLDKRSYDKNGSMKFESSDVRNNPLTELDMKKINLLQKYGYSYATAKEHFIKLNKDFHSTLEYLKENIPEEIECTIENIE